MDGEIVGVDVFGYCTHGIVDLENNHVYALDKELNAIQLDLEELGSKFCVYPFIKKQKGQKR